MTTKYLVDDLNPTGYIQVLEEVCGGAGAGPVHVRDEHRQPDARPAAGSPATSFYGYDAHGNVTFLTDATGAVTDTYEYDAWGNLVGSTGTTVNTRLYAGEEFDPDLGLLNLRARLYKASAGRFQTLDPAMGNPGRPITLNRFLYANGDPLNLIDPSGRGANEYSYLIVASQGVLNIGLDVFRRGSRVNTFSGLCAGGGALIGAILDASKAHLQGYGLIGGLVAISMDAFCMVAGGIAMAAQ